MRRSAWSWFAPIWLLFSSVISSARAQPAPSEVPPRACTLSWNAATNTVHASFDFSDLIDHQTRLKLKRGLPTEILLTALVYAPGVSEPVSTAYHRCKVTWHVWEEMYRVEIQDPARPGTRGRWTPTLNGVLRRCANMRHLLVATGAQIDRSGSLTLDVTVRINPISDKLLAKLKRWVSRPARTTAPTPGSALFSTFTGLFMQRIGDAEKSLRFKTKPARLLTAP